MSLPAAEVQRVRDETQRTRNRAARGRRAALVWAHDWVAAMDAQVRADAMAYGTLYTVRLPGFFPASAVWLPHAVEKLDETLAHFCASPATHGPTGARLAPLCARRAAFLERVK